MSGLQMAGTSPVMTKEKSSCFVINLGAASPVFYKISTHPAPSCHDLIMASMPLPLDFHLLEIEARSWKCIFRDRLYG